MRISPALVLGLLFAAGSADASWIREYDRGLQAVKQEDWAEAERRFAAAIREDANPEARRRFQGVVYRPYVPHYYAGLAAYRRGDCETAMRYWSHAPTVSVLARLDEERTEHQRGVGACQTRLAQAKPAAPAQPAPSTPSVARNEPPAATPAATPKPSPSVARTTPTTPPPQTSTRSSTTATATRSEPAPAPARPAQAAPSRPTASPAPAVLRSAVESWLAGNYTELLRTNAGSASDPRSRAQLHLFRAAAAFVLAEQAGQAEAGGLDNARQEVRAARAAESGLQPDEVLFSPRFRRFWQQTR
ncbi:hypothetical protein [Pseudomarimonas salicorniae]|uniref:Tetratricopeptide repeat-containing protein n=1 Tax=Pseudomarimonas salicorniae TaxID=2933270 RepID=A0ABT0GC91_9GAMM|nr:hypothetical protein [Lysobacter sp. CAU 1642]MCK7592161.1 hypothetical protein [Lysobacter sp. CAU 1642]